MAAAPQGTPGTGLTLGLLRHPQFHLHDPGPGHVESPGRLAAIDKALAKWPGLAACRNMAPRPATRSELLRVHTAAHLDHLEACARRSCQLDPDTHTSPSSHRAALLAAGGGLELCDAALAGEIQAGFALVRPPGHHATAERAMGFCLINNVSVAAAHLLAVHGLERVAILDWDVHHGNGTEAIFYQDPRVLYLSIHQSPLYPGTGQPERQGQDAGLGYNLNFPLPPGCGDQDYLQLWELAILPALRVYAPQFILVSAGFDIHREDILGGMRLSSAGMAALAGLVAQAAAQLCPGRLVATLEGGYALFAQARAVVAVLAAWQAGQWDRDLPAAANRAPTHPAVELASRTVRALPELV